MKAHVRTLFIARFKHERTYGRVLFARLCTSDGLSRSPAYQGHSFEPFGYVSMRCGQLLRER